MKDYGFEILAFECYEFTEKLDNKSTEAHYEGIEMWFNKFPVFANVKVNGFGASLLWKYL